MAFERWLPLFALLVACSGPTRFPLRAPLERDDDQRPFSNAPEEYYSPFAWDGANQSLFRPLSRMFAVDPAGRAVNVNAFDEVPDSSWFENRLGRRKMSREEVALGPCDDKLLDAEMPDGSWVIDRGKDNGANPGFRVNVPGLGKFMLKSDPPEEPDRATGATAIATRIYHAVGYHAPCDFVVYFRPSLLRLTPGLTVTNNQGQTHPFDQQALDGLLSRASHRNGLVRMVASKWLPGTPLGPYRYEVMRDDDPNDVVPHEDRRELRGGRLLAAWLNHFDSREQNTMDIFVRTDPTRKDGPGYVRHYVIDLGDCFGSVWSDDGISRRLGHSYLLDFGYIAEDFVSLGLKQEPWERAQRTGGVFNYFSARDFDPEAWRGEYPNPAFLRMTEADGAWMARILARFDDERVRAAVEVGKYDPLSETYLAETLLARRDAILKRYLSRLSPLSDVEVKGREVCATDLARVSGVVPEEGSSYRAYLYRGFPARPAAPVRFLPVHGARMCVNVPYADLSRQLPDEDEQRYVVLDLANGYAEGPLRLHLYDLGPVRGLFLAGIERPESFTPPD